MSDRVFFALAAAVALGMIALALAWPQGLGTRSPGPFGHAVKPPAAAQPLPAELNRRVPARDDLP